VEATLSRLGEALKRFKDIGRLRQNPIVLALAHMLYASPAETRPLNSDRREKKFLKEDTPIYKVHRAFLI
jgi:hypothetical protein